MFPVDTVSGLMGVGRSEHTTLSTDQASAAWRHQLRAPFLLVAVYHLYEWPISVGLSD